MECHPARRRLQGRRGGISAAWDDQETEGWEQRPPSFHGSGHTLSLLPAARDGAWITNLSSGIPNSGSRDCFWSRFCPSQGRFCPLSGVGWSRDKVVEGRGGEGWQVLSTPCSSWVQCEMGIWDYWQIKLHNSPETVKRHKSCLPLLKNLIIVLSWELYPWGTAPISPAAPHSTMSPSQTCKQTPKPVQTWIDASCVSSETQNCSFPCECKPSSLCYWCQGVAICASVW